MPQDSALERLRVAVHALVAGTGDIRNRLESADLSLHPLRADDFPESDLRSRFEAILRELTTADPGPDEGRVQATLRSMDHDAAVRLAERIVELYVECVVRRRIEEKSPDAYKGGVH